MLSSGLEQEDDQRDEMLRSTNTQNQHSEPTLRTNKIQNTPSKFVIPVRNIRKQASTRVKMAAQKWSYTKHPHGGNAARQVGSVNQN